MQAYCNVATEPARKVAATSGKAYYEFRAAESVKGDSEATWYTVRLFRDEAPGLKKGDFVCVTGKLKNDVFVARDGKPMGILTVLAFALTRITRDGKREDIVSLPGVKAPGAPSQSSTTPPQPPASDPKTYAVQDEVDNHWLSLV